MSDRASWRAGVLLVAGIAWLAPAAALAVDVCNAPANSQTTFARLKTFNKELPHGILIQDAVNLDDTRYVRLQFLIDAATGAYWNVSQRDSAGRPINSWSESSAQNSLWTERIPAQDPINLYVVGDAKVTLKQVLAMPESARNAFYSVQDANRPKFADVFAGGGEIGFLADATGMLVDTSGRAAPCCSGVMVGDGLFLTNWHCGKAVPSVADADENALWPADLCPDLFVDFSWDGDGTSNEHFCQRIVAKSKALDYVLMKVAPGNAGRPVAPTPLPDPQPAGAMVQDGSDLLVIHHPACMKKQVTRSCAVRTAQFPVWTAAANDSAAPKTQFTHACDTASGSSGAPVYWQPPGGHGLVLAGLHRAGFQRDGAGVCDRVNKATHMQLIIEDTLRKAADAGSGMDAQDRDLITATFGSQP